jgi:hypothetical protein
MKFNRWLVAFSVLTLSTLSPLSIVPLPLGAAEPAPAQETQKVTTGPLPESVKYWVLFRHLNALEAKAAEVEKRGLDGSPYRTAIRDSAQLTETQAAQLRSIATDCVSRVEEKDQEALKIIRAARAAASGGRLKKDPPALPEAPAELARLQSERDALIDSARESLRFTLGEQEFTKLQSFVDEKIAPQITREKVAPAGAPVVQPGAQR